MLNAYKNNLKLPYKTMREFCWVFFSFLFSWSKGKVKILYFTCYFMDATISNEEEKEMKILKLKL